MIVVVEPQMQGEKHVIVNAGILQILQNTFINDNIYLCMDELHLNKVLSKNYIKHSGLDTNRFSYDPKEDKKTNVLFKFLRQAILCFKIFKIAKRRHAKLIVFTSCFPPTAIFLNFLSSKFKQRILICQHGDLGVLLLDKQKLATKIFRYFIRKMLIGRNLEFNNSLIYGQSIKDKLLELVPEIKNENFIVIDHPYEYLENPHPVENSSIITIANIGTATSIKNSEQLFELSPQFSDEISEGKIKFSQIGSVSPEIDTYINDSVEVLVRGNDFVPNSIFQKSLEASDYFIYFFKTGGYYELCPSGTFFDAIKFLKPIIAIRNSYFEYYFSKLGNIGYLCEDLTEMTSIIKAILRGEKASEYEQQVINLKFSQIILNNSQLTDDFRSEYNKLFDKDENQ